VPAEGGWVQPSRYPHFSHTSTLRCPLGNRLQRSRETPLAAGCQFAFLRQITQYFFISSSRFPASFPPLLGEMLGQLIDACAQFLGLLAPLTRSRSIRWSVVISVENNHYAGHNSVNHRRNADESGHGGENGKGARRNQPGLEQAEATKECNPTSSAPLPRVVVGRPLHGMNIARSALGLGGGLY
jgi:hypothetical protein